MNSKLFALLSTLAVVSQTYGMKQKKQIGQQLRQQYVGRSATSALKSLELSIPNPAQDDEVKSTKSDYDNLYSPLALVLDEQDQQEPSSCISDEDVADALRNLFGDSAGNELTNLTDQPIDQKELASKAILAMLNRRIPIPNHKEVEQLSALYRLEQDSESPLYHKKQREQKILRDRQFAQRYTHTRTPSKNYAPDHDAIEKLCPALYQLESGPDNPLYHKESREKKITRDRWVKLLQRNGHQD